VAQVFCGKDGSMPPHVRANGGDSLAAGHARQRLKLLAIGYASARHGVDGDLELVRAALTRLRQGAVEYVEAAAPHAVKNRRIDRPGNSEMLQLAALSYANARHGIDADVGMAREGLAMLCQAAIGYVEVLPWEDSLKRSTGLHLQLGNGG
jgi:hypothetical protein